MKKEEKKHDQRWREFVEGEVYADADVPWRDDPAFALITGLPGLRESIGGRIEPALMQAIGLTRALAQVDLIESVHRVQPRIGLCLGFGMNALEPVDLLHVFGLDRVHAYEWIGAEVVAVARMLEALCVEESELPNRIRLHHETISNLSALADASVHVVYTANVFNREVPMSLQTLDRAVSEIVRVLSPDGILLSRGSADVLEERLAQYGRLLVHLPLVSVFMKD